MMKRYRNFDDELDTEAPLVQKTKFLGHETDDGSTFDSSLSISISSLSLSKSQFQVSSQNTRFNGVKRKSTLDDFEAKRRRNVDGQFCFEKSKSDDLEWHGAENQPDISLSPDQVDLGTSTDDIPSFTFDQLFEFCRLRIEERENKLRISYEAYLEKLVADQYQCFSRFMQEQADAKGSPSYLK